MKCISATNAAKVLHMTRGNFLRLAEKWGVRCIYLYTPQPDYARQPSKRGTRKYLVSDVIKLVDALYTGDKGMIDRMCKNLEDQRYHYIGGVPPEKVE